MGWVDEDLVKGKMDPRLEEAKGISTSTPVVEPGGNPAPVSAGGKWVDAPEEAANAAPAPKSSLTDLRHEAYRGAIPLPEKAINAIEAFGNAHDPFNPHGNYDEELAKVQNREAAIKQEHPALATGAKIAGAVVPGTGLIKGAQAALGTGRAAAYGGAALGSAIQGGAQEGPQGAALGALGGAGGQALGEGLSAIARRFPWLADRLAERLTGQTAKQVAARVQGTARGNFAPGDYERVTSELGLNRLTPGGALKAAQKVMDESALGPMREGLSASPEEVRQAISQHPALDDLRDALQLTPSPAAAQASPVASRATASYVNAPGESGGLKGLSSDILKRNPQLAQILQGKVAQAAAEAPTPAASQAPISLDKLAEETRLNVTNRLNKLRLQEANPNLPTVSQSEVRALQQSKTALDNLQKAKIVGSGAATADAYDESMKNYAVAAGVSRGAAKDIGRATVRRTVGALVGGTVGGPVGFAVGGTVGDRPLAYGALKAYQAARAAPVQALAKAAKVATPGVSAAVARASASGESAQAGAAIQKAQANSQEAREPDEK